MNDDRIRELLRELPRAAARPGFNQKVYARLETAAPVRTALATRRFAWGAIAVVGVIALLSAGALHIEGQNRRHRQLTEIAQMQAQQAQLAAELAELRDLAQDSSRLSLGTDDDVEYVLDFGARAAGATAAPAARRPLVSQEP